MAELAVLVTCPPMQASVVDWRSRFDALGIKVGLPEVVQQLSPAELMALLPAYDGMIAGDDPLNADVLHSAARLRVVSKWGIGLDSIDLGAAAELGIRVTNTPDTFGDEVADVAIGYLVMLARWAQPMAKPPRSRPNIAKLLDKVTALPAVRRAYEREGVTGEIC